ncbi:MAG: ACT domain-containing protein [Verrucomicrobia bacterium]|nr:ACT domain-containing protein [Verrucomicrobiota bacterium]
MGAVKTQEITITAPNEVGTMGKVFGLVAKAGVNVKSFVAYSMGNQGTFKLITADNAKVAKLAEEAGYTVETTDVAVVTCTDAIGTGSDLGEKLGHAGVNIDYAYATGVGGGEAVVVFSVDDVAKAVKALA